MGAATALLAGCFVVDGNSGMNEAAMNCHARPAAEVREILKNIRDEPVYAVAKGQAQGVVHFELDIPGLDMEKEADTLIFIGSAKADGMIFAGPLKPRFSVEFDERLTQNGSADNIEFRLFRLGKNQICVQAQQVGEPYWQPGATAKIKFLRGSYTHEKSGVPISFEVMIER